MTGSKMAPAIEGRRQGQVMDALAVVIDEPERMRLTRLPLPEPEPHEALVEVDYSGISTGTEMLLWQGRMPPFPGMGYPLVPGYETVGRVVAKGADVELDDGAAVFVPGANCFDGVRGLFGGAASKLVVPANRLVPLAGEPGPQAALLALAATAGHALAGGTLPELVIGHGVLGRLLARLSIAMGGEAPTVWEADPARQDASGYAVMSAADDPRRDYKVIVDASGDAGILDQAIARLATGGEVLLAGFYHERVSFAYPMAFMREARIRIAAEWKPEDMQQVLALLSAGKLDLSGLITHSEPAQNAEAAYRTAFSDRACLKMILDWRGQA